MQRELLTPCKPNLFQSVVEDQVYGEPRVGNKMLHRVRALTCCKAEAPNTVGMRWGDRIRATTLARIHQGRFWCWYEALKWKAWLLWVPSSDFPWSKSLLLPLPLPLSLPLPLTLLAMGASSQISLSLGGAS